MPKPSIRLGMYSESFSVFLIIAGFVDIEQYLAQAKQQMEFFASFFFYVE